MKFSAFNKLIAFCLGVFVFPLALLGLGGCNLSTPEEVYYLKVSVHDSLAVESGKYDTLEIDLLDTNGMALQKRVFFAPYFLSDKDKLAKLPLLAAPPAAFTVRITAHAKNSDAAWVLTSKVVNGTPGALVLTWVPGNPSDTLPDTVTVTPTPTALPDSITLRMPVPMILATTDAASPILWSVWPDTASQEVLWTSADSTTAQVTPDNKVKPLKLGKTTLTGITKAKPSVQVQFEVDVIAAVQVDSISLTPKSLRLYTGGAPGQVNVTLFGNDSGAQYALSSSDAAIASVNATGLITPLKPGLALIKASVVGQSDKASQCSVTVVTDTPAVTLSPDQTVAYGGEAVFKISVTQAYGTVAEIKADMDGNGVYEQTLLAVDTATFRATYNDVKIYELNFQVKDSEGNAVNLMRKVTVSPPAAPTIQITDPASPITVNTLAYTVKFTVKDPTKPADESKDSAVTLAEGPNTIVVRRTNAGGTGSAQVVITVNRTAPGTPVFAAQAAVTADNTPTWSWVAVPGAAKYQVRLDNNDFTQATGTLDVTLLSHTPAALADGLHTLYVRSLDNLGNASSPASQAVTVDTRPPAAVTFTGLDSSFTASETPTWTWTPSTTNAGTGVYVLKLGTGAEFDWTSTTFTPTSALTDNAIHTLTVRERDQVPGVVGAAKSFSFRIKVNPPAAPTVRSAATVANNGLTNNPNFSWTSGGGGNGRYRLRVNSETTYRITGVAQTTWALPTTAADGVYTIRVSEQDELGRWGAEGTFTITLDRTAPQFTTIRIQGKSYNLRDGYITNAASLIINYTSEAVARQISCALTDNAATVCRGTAITDAAGNSATFQISIWRRSNVIFFQPNGTGDGSSWEDAAGDIQAVVDQAGSDGKDFWLASGDYTTGNNSLTIWGKTVNMLGGFQLASFPTSSAGRVKGATILAHISFMGSNGNFDGLQFNSSQSGLGLGLSLGTAETPATFVDCIFRGGFEMALGGSIRFTNCQMTGVNRSVPMRISAGTMVWTGGSITNNTPTSGNYAIEIGSGASATFNGSPMTISGNKPTFVSHQIRNEGHLVIATTVTMPCTDILWEEGSTGSCGGVSR